MVKTLRSVAVLTVAYLLAFLLWRGLFVQPCDPEDEDVGGSEQARTV
jgi:hypothetical protein